MKKIIIFGATGNVGAYVLKYARQYFQNKDYEVIASGRRNTNFFANRGIPYYPVDITKEEEFDKLPTEDVYAVIDLATVIPSYMRTYHPEQYLETNIIGNYNILEYCRKVCADRILFSTTVFDISLAVESGNILKPNLSYNFSYKGDHAMYVISKITAIELLEHYYQEYGLKKFVFRFPTIYNYSSYHYYFPNGKKTMRPVYRMIELAQSGHPIELWGDPNYAKDMVHVYDCAQMLCKAIEVEKEGGFYNVGTGIPVTLEEQIETIIEVFSPKENPSTIIYRPDLKSGGGFLMDVGNAKSELGYIPQYDCKKLFEDFKEEMKIDRFKELRRNNDET